MPIMLTLAAAAVLHYGVIPKGDPAHQRATLQPVIRYLEGRLGTKIDLDIPKDYATLIEGCMAGKYDVAHLGGYSYVQVHERVGWTPLVQGALAHSMHSVFVTQTGSDIKSIFDLKGKSFGFGDPNSASDYLMPTYYLDVNNMPARATFKRIETTTQPVVDVANFKLDAAVVEEVNFEHAVAANPALKSQVRVFYTSPAFPDNVWAARSDLSADLRQRWTKAFLDLDAKRPADKEVLAALRAPAFIVPRNEDYAKVRDAVLLEGLLITKPQARR